MKISFIEYLVKAIVMSDLLISISGGCVVFITYRVLNLPIDFHSLLIGFSLVLFTYSFNKKTDIEEDMVNNKSRFDFTNKWSSYLNYISIIILLYELVNSFVLNHIYLFVVVYFLVVGFSYSFFRLKKILLLKNIIIGTTWSSLCFMAYSNDIDTKVFYFIVLNVSISWFVNSVIFDIKDVKGDRLQKINTLPVVFSVKTVKKGLFLVLICLAFLDGVYYFYSLIELKILFVFLVVILWVMLSVFYSKQKYNYKFYGLFLDSEYIFATILMFLM